MVPLSPLAGSTGASHHFSGLVRDQNRSSPPRRRTSKRPLVLFAVGWQHLVLTLTVEDGA